MKGDIFQERVYQSKRSDIIIMKKIFAVFMVLIVGVIATSCTDRDSVWKQARVLRLDSKAEVLQYYERFAGGEEFMLDEEVEALKAYEQLHPEEFKEMNHPLIIKLEGEVDAFIIYTDNEGNVKTTKGETLGTID